MNTPKLKAKIAERNIKQAKLGEIWGCTRQTVYCKINGKTPITTDEAQKFSELAELTDTEKVNIFLSDG